MASWPMEDKEQTILLLSFALPAPRRPAFIGSSLSNRVAPFVQQTPCCAHYLHSCASGQPPQEVLTTMQSTVNALYCWAAGKEHAPRPGSDWAFILWCGSSFKLMIRTRHWSSRQRESNPLQMIIKHRITGSPEDVSEVRSNQAWPRTRFSPSPNVLGAAHNTLA